MHYEYYVLGVAALSVVILWGYLYATRGRDGETLSDGLDYERELIKKIENYLARQKRNKQEGKIERQKIDATPVVRRKTVV